MMQILPPPLQIPHSPPLSLPCSFIDVIGHSSTLHEQDSILPQTRSSYTAKQIKLPKQLTRLILPEYAPTNHVEFSNVEFYDEVQGRSYCLVSKNGSQHSMEDRYNVDMDISGDPSQALFSVIDGHGGHDAANYVAENLGKNILRELEDLTIVNNEQGLEQAIRGGYSKTDKDFLSQGVHSGACAASVLLMNGTLHVANVGDCRVVLSRRGIATRLTNDHRPSRQDERYRIESNGGVIDNCNGVWRIEGSLAVSRAIGDLQMKKWVISEPEFEIVCLTLDCEFLIMASDGLWEKVSEQEAVDVVSREEVGAMESCKKLVDMSGCRGSKDDITVLVINLQHFSGKV